MTSSGFDYFTRLILSLKTLATGQAENTGQFPEDDRHTAPSPALIELAEALTRLPPENSQRIAYNDAMDQAAVMNLGPSLEAVERDHVANYRANYPKTRDPKRFLETLIADIDSLIDDAELNANDANDDDLEQVDIVNVRADEIARGIACKKAEDGAREAAEEAYRLAYRWAYEDIFEEAYDRALSQLIEPARPG